MDTIQELRKVIEIQLNYMGDSKKGTDSRVSPLSAIRHEISKYKSQLRLFTTISIMLGSVVCLAAIAAVLGATWVPWEYVGIVVIASFAVILPTIQFSQKLEQLKKRELFLLMLHKMDHVRSSVQ